MEIEIRKFKVHSDEEIEKLGGERVQIELVVVNSSSIAVKSGGRWAVKDDDQSPSVVAQAFFGRIPPGGSEQQFVNLPSGFEAGWFVFEPEDGSGSWTAPHFGNNTLAAKLTLGDN